MQNVIVNSWSFIMDPDEEGAMISVEYECPLCGQEISDLLLVSVKFENIYLDEDFESDQVCPYCRGDVTLRFRQEDQD